MKHSGMRFSAQLFNVIFVESAAAQMYALAPTPAGLVLSSILFSSILNIDVFPQ